MVLDCTVSHRNLVGIPQSPSISALAEVLSAGHLLCLSLGSSCYSAGCCSRRPSLPPSCCSSATCELTAHLSSLLDLAGPLEQLRNKRSPLPPRALSPEAYFHLAVQPVNSVPSPSS